LSASCLSHAGGDTAFNQASYELSARARMSFLAQWNPPGYAPTSGETAYNTALMVLWQLLYWPSIVLYAKRSALFPLRGRAFWAAYIYVALIYIEGGQPSALCVALISHPTPPVLHARRVPAGAGDHVWQRAALRRLSVL
jgi:hypothetical protein